MSEIEFGAFRTKLEALGKGHNCSTHINRYMYGLMLQKDNVKVNPWIHSEPSL